MNVRISERGVRFRVTRDDIAVLLAGESLESVLPLPGGEALRYGIIPGGEAFGLASRPGALLLCVPSVELRELAERPPSREGIEAEIALNDAVLRVSLEIDVRRKLQGSNSTG